MDNLQKLRSGTHNLPTGHPGVIGSRNGHQTNATATQRAQAQMYLNPTSLTPSSGSGSNIDDLTHSLRGMGLQNPGYSQSAQTMPYLLNGQIMYGQNPYYAQQASTHAMSPSSTFYPANGATMMGNGSYNGYNGSQFADHSPTNFNSSRVTSGNMSSIITPRRSSGGSSNEPDVPGTPFTQYTGFGGGFPVFDNSPASILSWSTSSPTEARFLNKAQQPTQIPLHLQRLCQQPPPIPKAVPAPFSPTKPLERRLENPNGITNVYIRGLQPNTTDDMLYTLAKRFGDIESSKAIIDMGTGLCKGFGFVKYYKFEDAEDCIRGFHFCGYETSFARESFYSQLKKLADTDATNLYISNLPIEFNEHDLGAIFEGQEVCSKRILRNPDGSGRGVGFARFASHEVCEKVVREFNNHPVVKGNGETHNIQIRYADTPEQKALKQQTTAARQYRSAEYESQTQSPNALMARLGSQQEFGPWLAAFTGNYQANGCDAGVVPPRGNPVGVTTNGSAGEDDDTIHASIPVPVKQENAEAKGDSASLH